MYQKIIFAYMLYNGPYLRVTSIRTTNGNNPEIGDDGRVKTKEAHLPMTARDLLEKQNRGLPKHLRKTIEVISAPHLDPPKPEELTPEQLQAQIDKLMAIQAAKTKPLAAVDANPVVPKQAAKPTVPNNISKPITQ